MIKVVKKLKFEASHRLYEYEGACSNIHGHSYIVEVCLTSHEKNVDCESNSELDKLGMVVDFGVIKKTIGSWLDINWDHALLYNENDHALSSLSFPGTKRYSFIGNPTAENMARLLFENDWDFGNKNVRLLWVRVWETADSYAEANGS